MIAAQGRSATLPGRPLPVWPLTAALALVWLLLAPRTPDLAAQVYRTTLFSHHGFTVWDNTWYAGHHLPAYSLVYPPLASLLGPRLVGAAAAVCSAILFERITRRRFGDAARAGALWFAVAVLGDLVIGRLTFALGVAVGLAAIELCVTRRGAAAVAVGAVCAAASPVTGLFLALAGFADALAWRRTRALGMAFAALGTTLALSMAFPEGGTQPFGWLDLIVLVAVSAGVVACVPARERSIRIGALIYAGAALLAYAIPTPMGGNAIRLGTLFAGPLVVAATARRLGRRGRPAALLLAVVLVVCAVWQWRAPVTEASKAIGDPAFSASYYRPLIGFLRRQGPTSGRLEVPFTRSHWETVHLADHAILARGWERQLDRKYDPLFYAPRLSAARYRRWLRHDAVRYVALPDAPLDSSARAEARLVASAPPFLEPVWRSAHWRVYAVRDPVPLVSGPGVLRHLDVSSFRIEMRRAGTLLVRVHFSRWWTVEHGAACVSAGPDQWTLVRAARPGPVSVSAEISSGGVLERPSACAPAR